MSRIYLGIHWQFDNLEGQNLGASRRRLRLCKCTDATIARNTDRRTLPKIEFVPINKHAISSISEITI